MSNLDDLNMLPELPNNTFLSHIRLSYDIDFEKCLKQGIDAIELCWYGEEWSHKARDDMYFSLYGWDCDSMVILNPDIVIQMRGE